MKTRRIAMAIVALLIGGAAASIAPPAVRAQGVRAVLFFSPTCPHCEQVMTQDLPTFFQVYGGRPQVLMDQDARERARYAFLVTNGQLEILMVDASRPEGGTLYQASLERYPTGPQRLGVPRLIVNDQVLVGSIEIPARLHRIIRDGLATGGTAWPTIAGLDRVVDALRPTALAAEDADTGTAAGAANDSLAEAAPGGEMAAAQQPGESATAAIALEQIVGRRASVRERFLQDPVGNSLSVVVLLLMIGSVVAVLRLAEAGGPSRATDLAIPLAALVGMAVAGYLTYIEASGATAVCGPVGDCNTVNQSEYAVLFGVLPVGALGLAGYAAMLGGWAVARWARGSAADLAWVSLLALALVGTVFSIYLTFLEPFVIGATCAWCLTSAVLITLLLWLSAGPGIAAWARLQTSASSA